MHVNIYVNLRSLMIRWEFKREPWIILQTYTVRILILLHLFITSIFSCVLSQGRDLFNICNDASFMAVAKFVIYKLLYVSMFMYVHRNKMSNKIMHTVFKCKTKQLTLLNAIFESCTIQNLIVYFVF